LDPGKLSLRMEPESPDKPQLSADEVSRLRNLVLERAKQLSEDDLRLLLSKEAKAEKRVSAAASALPRFVAHVRLGFDLIRDYARGTYRNIPWWSVASVAAGLSYVLLPTDLIPDFIPGIGFLDDAAVLAAVMAGIREDLKKYAAAKGVSLE
jgi:uncharacterized membrane protein YkvA (DUF1232 family)